MVTQNALRAHTPNLRIETLRTIQKAASVLSAAGLVEPRDLMVAHTQRVLTPGVVVAVVGAPGSGKSAVVNGAMASTLLVVDERFHTSVATFLRDTPKPELAIRTFRDGQVATIGVATEGLPSLTTSLVNDDNSLDIFRAEVGVPNPVLAMGFTLLDTPPEDLPARGASRASALASVVDALVLALPANRAITPGELNLLRRTRDRGTAAVVAVTKMDAVESSADAVEEVRAALADHHLDVAVIGTSYSWRILGASRPEDPSIDAASGFGSLGDELIESVRKPAQDLAARRAIAEARAGITQVEILATAAQSTAGDPIFAEALDRAVAILAELDRADAHWVRSLGERFTALAVDLVQQAEAELEKIASMSRVTAARSRLDETFAAAIVSIGCRSLELRAEVVADLVAEVQRETNLPLGPVLMPELLRPQDLWPAGTAWNVEGFRDPARRFYDLAGMAAASAAARQAQAGESEIGNLVLGARTALSIQVEALAVAAANGAAVGIGRRLAGFRRGLERVRSGPPRLPDRSAVAEVSLALAQVDRRLSELGEGSTRDA